MDVEHELKCWPVYFDAIERGKKPFDVRYNDRCYQKGDTVLLRRYSVNEGFTEGKEIRAEITFVLPGGQFGIDAGWCVLGLRVIEQPTHRHEKTGALYHFVAHGNHSETLEKQAIYRGQDGAWWVRPREMFDDGRFTDLRGEGEAK